MHVIKQSKWCKLTKLERTSKTLLLTVLTNNDHTIKHEDTDHLLNPSRISSIRELLHAAKSEATKGSVLITTAEGESFCLGLDTSYAEAGCSDEVRRHRFQEMIDGFKHVITDLISLPMPTIAAINGHATGAGLMLGISHDYLTIKSVHPRNSSDHHSHPICSHHLSMEMSLPPYFAALIRSKVDSPLARRRLILRDMQFDSDGAAKIGLLDKLREVGDHNALEKAEELAKELSGQKWNGEVYAELRKSLHPELCKELGLTHTPILPKLKSSM